MTIGELSSLYREGSLSPVEVVDQLLSRIAERNDDLRAFIHVNDDAARAAARGAERAIREGRATSRLAGVPIAHKDIIHTKDAPTTAHSRVFQDSAPTFDATVVSKLRAAGMISIGKANLGEFACGGMELYGMPRNPWKPGRYTGGSSGGSAAAVAAGLVPVATGTDTGGSIRVPSSFCGVVGVKPTRGRVSNHGVMPLSWTMDTVGPMTRTVADAAILLQAMSGHDSNDLCSSDAPVPDFGHYAHHGVEAMKIGIPAHHFYDGLPQEIEAAVRRDLETLSDLGAELVSVDLPLAAELAATGSVLVMVEAYAVHADTLASRPQDYSVRARRRIAAGGLYTQADIHAAQAIAGAWVKQLEAVMETVEVLVTPTLNITAFTLDQQEHDPPDTSWGTRHFNIAGLPAMTIPCGIDAKGLPIGLQIAARKFDEPNMFRVAFALEAARTPIPTLAGDAT